MNPNQDSATSTPPTRPSGRRTGRRPALPRQRRGADAETGVVFSTYASEHALEFTEGGFAWR